MGGKASLFLIFGFAYIFAIYQLKTGNVVTKAVENYVDYYKKTTSHQIAVSGLNIAAAKLYEDFNWRGPLQDIQFCGGTFSILFGGSTDTLEVKSFASYEGYTDTVIAYFSGSSLYTDYTFLTANENGVAWTDGDTVWGPIHTNGVLNHQNKNTIVFYGKVTAGQSISPPPQNSKTNFLGGYEVGVFVPEVDNINDLINAAYSGGYKFPFGPDPMKIEFHANGTVDVYHGEDLIHDDISLATLAPNGAIYSEGTIEILGEKVNTPPNGITICSGNDVILRDEIEYADDPEQNPNSDDLLAVVAWNNIVIDNTQKTNWKVQAVLMAINGSLTAIDMNKNGKFDYYGSLYQKNRGNAKMFKSFQKKYKHDERLSQTAPPFYPGMSNFRLIAWWE